MIENWWHGIHCLFIYNGICTNILKERNFISFEIIRASAFLQSVKDRGLKERYMYERDI
jgi:hypothetical protein